jgi:hypothetical protein
MFTFIGGLVVLILDLWAIIRCWSSTLSLTAKVLWTLVIIVFPILGFVLYLLFGRAAVPAR